MRMLWQVFWAAAPAHWLFGISCIRATMVSKVTWRGIEYRIRGKRDIERLNYHPYVPSAADQTHSI